MRMKRSRQAGFTLIEVIVTLIIMSIAGTMLISFMGTNLTQSADPLFMLNDNCEIDQAIEAINADYRARLESDSSQDMSFYVGDLTEKESIDGIPAGVSVVGKYVAFSDPDAQKKVTETAAAGTMYVKVTARKNNSALVTILGN